MTGLTAVRFVAARRANLFMTELLEGIAAAVRDLGVAAEVVDGFGAAAEPGAVSVVIPHEWFATTPREGWPSGDVLARTVAVCTEQPGTPWFDVAHAHAARSGGALDISRVALREHRRRGLACDHLQLGYVPAWDAWQGDVDAERPVDVLYMGTLNRRRDRLLASYGRTLWRRRSELVVTTTDPKPAPGPDFFVGDAKRAKLRGAEILLSPGRQAAPYFEWVRAIEAIANGCVLLCDHAADHGPLEPGEHFVSGHAESLGLLADGLLDRPERLRGIRAAAYEVLRAELPMSRAAERLVALAEALCRAPARNGGAPPPPAPPPPEPPRPEPLAAADGGGGVAPIVKSLALDAIRLRRRLGRLEAAADGGGDPGEPEILHVSPAWDGAACRVSVCVPCFNYEHEVAEAIASVAVQEGEPCELLVLDDASDDGSRAAIRAALETRPWLPAMLLGVRANGGLPHARNQLVQRARGTYVLMLDADNAVYPTAAARLAAALDAAPDALFAYPALEGREGGEPHSLLSYRAWDPRLLAHGNFVDALALLRRDALRDLGGYTEDLRMYGWEDYELWVRAAERGLRGVHVPEILARYRLHGASMRSVTDIDTTAMFALLRERYPATMAAASTLVAG